MVVSTSKYDKLIDEVQFIKRLLMAWSVLLLSMATYYASIPSQVKRLAHKIFFVECFKYIHQLHDTHEIPVYYAQIAAAISHHHRHVYVVVVWENTSFQTQKRTQTKTWIAAVTPFLSRFSGPFDFTWGDPFFRVMAFEKNLYISFGLVKYFHQSESGF